MAQEALIDPAADIDDCPGVAIVLPESMNNIPTLDEEKLSYFKFKICFNFCIRAATGTSRPQHVSARPVGGNTARLAGRASGRSIGVATENALCN